MKQLLNNPWQDLSNDDPPYILPCDLPLIDCFNKVVDREHQIVVGQIPEPWLGPIDTACVAILQLNPGYKFNDLVDHKKHSFIGKTQCPHYGLVTKSSWWRGCLKQLALDIGKDCMPTNNAKVQLEGGYEYLKTRVCSIEYFPYGSQKSKISYLRIPSQDFTFHVVRQLIERKVVFVVLKGWNEWTGTVPELLSIKDRVHKGLAHIKRQKKCVTPGIFGNDAYNKILQALITCSGNKVEGQ